MPFENVEMEDGWLVCWTNKDSGKIFWGIQTFIMREDEIGNILMGIRFINTPPGGVI
ncbi:hypothetical protein [Methanobacterium sp. CWC-01]|uniref:hypothetical protein n=1 Tax=Methanobacterium aridiramus TaxID=2584467 RepID=UPI002576F577|nr:hypothetical protein [Methanobacterium sp. CWC-01]